MRVIKVENIKDYLNEPNLDKIINEIYEVTSHLENVYLDYKKWFYNKQVKNIHNGTRIILFIKNDKNKIIAICNLKNTADEKKLCTLFVKERYRNKGLGSRLIEESFNILNTNKPLVTISKNNLKIFSKIIEKYNWVLTKIIGDEYYYN